MLRPYQPDSQHLEVYLPNKLPAKQYHNKDRQPPLTSTAVMNAPLLGGERKPRQAKMSAMNVMNKI